MLGVDDEGNKFELAPDPMNEELQEQFKDIVVGKPETFKEQLKPILSNERLFFTDLYKDGVGEKIEGMFREMIAALIRASVGAAVVAMTMAAGIMAAMPGVAGLSPVYLAAMICAIVIRLFAWE